MFMINSWTVCGVNHINELKQWKYISYIAKQIYPLEANNFRIRPEFRQTPPTVDLR